MGATDHVRLVDHHCHGLMPGDIDGTEFRLLATEADVLSDPGLETLDHQFGLGIRAFCAPELGLPAHSTIDEYLTRRAEIGAVEINRRLLAATRSDLLINDTGFTASPVMGPAAMTEATGIPGAEVVRLERIAEETAATADAAGFAAAFRDALAAASQRAVGFKSIIAYRYGFDIADHAPSDGDVVAATSEWFREIESTGRIHISHPVLLQFILWEAIPYGKPIQMHTGYGDSDIQLFRADPSRATRFFLATQNTGAKFTLLHCYPFLREAAILSQVFPHVYCDAGVVSHYLGPSAITAHRHLLEIAPFNKILYSSDAYGLAEHYYISARSWRRSYDRILDEWIDDGWTDARGAEAIVNGIARDNALRIYGLEGVR